ncbi:hypothetical protein [Pelolinea submarina]|uniref:Uncharacterized protein n=1 Tax=Pelolinea submarina TaxID=913107 RepID=A0A347ZRW2_9CHLR|nr:hypothetical protein [Pelolinea submarina]REG11403.1 hypothetical protein DFR64_1284 [Pelolinea submarina]BBB48043.1 hypothetical protein Pelsub_P1271 [Pelolinea submarina]
MNTRSLFIKNTQTLSTRVDPPAQQILSLGRHNGWGFHILGYADLPEKPVRLEKWLIVPAHEDNSPIPGRTLERIQTIFAAGLRPRGFVVVHEAPMSLPAPQQAQQSFGWSAPAAPQPNAPSGLSSLTSLAEGLAAMLGVITTTIFPMLFLGLLALDPIVVAVMEDGCWVEIDRWLERPLA